MSISSDADRKAGPYAGTGSQTSFPFSFKVFLNTDVLVVAADASGNQTTKDLNTDYTVALNADQNNNPGGTVNMVSPPASGTTLTIGSQVPATQGVTLSNAGGFYPSVINDALDRMTILVQQVKEILTRTLTLPLSVPNGVSTQLPLPSAGKGLKWAPDGKSITNSTNDPDTVAAQAQTSADNAATSATNAATSATNAANSATAAGNSATAASNSASQAQTSAANAQAAASSVGFRNVKFLTHANSPYNVTAADSGYLISIDTSLGNVAVSLPAIGTLTLPFSIGFKKSTTDANSVTLTAGGTDKFDSGSASKSISTGGAGTTLVPEASTNPAEWVASDWGALGGQQSKQQFAAGTGFTAGTSTTVTLTNTPLPGSAQSLEIFFDGSYQQESEWSYNPTNGVVTFGSAIPAGVAAVEAVWATPLVVGTPADGTVTGAKIATGDKAAIQQAIGLAPGTAAGDILQLDGNGKIPAADGSQLINLLPLLHVREEQPSGTSGGTNPAGTWTQRTLNTVKTNQITGASLSGSEVTLPAGTYYIEAVAPSFAANSVQARIRNATDNVTLLVGQSDYSNNGVGAASLTTVSGMVTLTAQKLLLLSHYTQTSQTGTGFGKATNSGEVEVYSEVKIWKIA